MKDNDTLPENEDQIRLPKWHVLYKLPEFYTLAVSLLALIMLSAEAVYLHFLREGVYLRHIWSILGMHLTGGAALGVLQAAKYPYMQIYDNILLNGIFAIFLIFAFAALFGLSCRGLLHAPWLKNCFSSVQNGAQTQKKTWMKFGIPGVFIFVLFPLTGTGPVVGFVLGKIMGLGYWTNLLTVCSACLTTVAGFAFLGDTLSDKLGDRTLTYIVLGIVAFLLAGAILTKIRAWYAKRKAEKNL